MQKKLKEELKMAKKLKKPFIKECTKAQKTMEKKQIIQVVKTQKKLCDLQRKIDRTKNELNNEPKGNKAALKAELKAAKAEMSGLQDKMKTLFAKLQETANAVKLAPKEKKAALKETKKKLEKKFDAAKGKVDSAKKNYLLLKLQYKKECDIKIKKEQDLATIYVKALEEKLKLVKERAKVYKCNMNIVKQEAGLKAKVEKIKLQMKTETNDVSRKALEESIDKLNKQILDLNKKNTDANKEANELQLEFNKKTEDYLEMQRVHSLKKEEELKKIMKEELDKKLKLKKALLAATDKNVRKALLDQKNKAKAAFDLLQTRAKILADSAKILKKEIKLRQEALSTQQKEIQLKAILIEKAEKERLAKLELKLTKKAQEDEKTSLDALNALYAKKIATLKKLLQETLMEKSGFAAKYKTQFETEKARKILEVDNEFKTKIELISDQIRKEKSLNRAYKLKAEETLEKKIKEITQKMATLTKQKVSELTKKLKAEQDKQAKALKLLLVNLKQKFITQKSNLDNKIQKIKAQIAALKAESLKNIAKLKADLAKEKTKADELKISIQQVKDEGIERAAQFEKLKNTTMTENQIKIEKREKEKKALMAKTEAILAKIRAEYASKKANLEEQITTAKKEASTLGVTLKLEKAKYKELNTKYKNTKVSMKKKHEGNLAAEQKVYKIMKSNQEFELKKCQEALKKIETEVKTIKADIKTKVAELKKLTDKSAKRRKIGDAMLKDLKSLDEESKKIDDQEAKRKDTCEKGTPGQDLKDICDTMKKDIEKLQKSVKASQTKIDKSRKEFDAI